ncbi:GNAT family N-acetyltransferase [Flavobacterium sp.]|uniref:GNAT family N-acetyltransferase n=1 Tax=Flavobacterium sp. TaxID=239 RepID=UPI00375357AF
MGFSNWKLDELDKVQPNEFFELVQKNKTRIENTLTITVANCESQEKINQYFKIKNQNQINKTDFYFYIRNIETNNLIGYIGIKKIDYKILKCELFYFVDKNFEGKGIISKAVKQIINHCFEELLMNKIIICTSKINIGSQQIALKHNFKQEGILRNERLNHLNEYEDIVYFGLLKSDYII